MKQVLLALVLIAVPVSAFTAFQVYARSSSATPSGLGDLSSFQTIVSDVQAMAAKGDFAGAARRITDYEAAWDQAETAIRPLNPTEWGNIDDASDAAIKALREPQPSAGKVQQTLAALMAVLGHPDTPAV